MATQWLGEGDSGGPWFTNASNTKFWGGSGQLVLGVGTLAYLGLTFMKNVLVLSRDFWMPSLGTPYSGQLFPTGGNSGGPGQVYPF